MRAVNHLAGIRHKFYPFGHVTTVLAGRRRGVCRVEQQHDTTGGPGVTRRAADPGGNRPTARAWWDADADFYQDEHGEFLGSADFRGCPEGLREADARLLGDVRGRPGGRGVFAVTHPIKWIRS